MTDDTRDTLERLIEQWNSFLSNGGLFNPALTASGANEGALRQLALDTRDYLAALRQAEARPQDRLQELSQQTAKKCGLKPFGEQAQHIYAALCAVATPSHAEAEGRQDPLLKLIAADYDVIAEAVNEFLGFDITTRDQQDRISSWAKASVPAPRPEDGQGRAAHPSLEFDAQHLPTCSVNRNRGVPDVCTCGGDYRQTRVEPAAHHGIVASRPATEGATEMIRIQQSATADTRTCDFTKVTKETLLASSHQHISDVRRALDFFMAQVCKAGQNHDPDKITDIDGFHRDFVTGFAVTEWWDRHRPLNRHHLQQADGVPADVNLIDVLDFIADCVMAGMGRSGSVYPLNLSPELLETAFQNTVELLKREVVVEPLQPEGAPKP